MNLNINESSNKYALDKLVPGSDVATDLYAKTLLEYQDRARFWKPSIDIGAKCQSYLRRDIFTPAQRKGYRDLGKIPVEPQEMKTAINVLVDQVQKGVKSTIISFDDDSPPSSSANPEVVNVVMKDMKLKVKLDRLKRGILKDSLVTGFPCWLWFDLRPDITGTFKSLVAYQPKWDSMLLPRWFNQADGGDIDDVMKVSFVEKRQLKEWYPDRYEKYKSYDPTKTWNKEDVSRVLNDSPENTVYNRASVIMDAINGREFNDDNGRIMLTERFFVLNHAREVAINEKTHKVAEIPEDWELDRKERWKNEHPDFDVINNNVKTLWVTTIASDGFVWENNQHWFQSNNSLPGEVYIPDMGDQIPTAVGNDMLPYVLSVAASETEGLHQVRTGTGTTTHIVEGTLKDPDDVKKELSSANGVVRHTQKAVRDLGGIRNSFVTEQRKPNATFFDFSERTREKMDDAIGLNDALMGATNPRQSNKAKLTDITQGLSTQSAYIMNYNDFCLDLENLMLCLIPYNYTAETIIQINDDYGMEEQTSMIVNQQGFDYSGQGLIIANDLTNTRYIAIPMLSDDSPSSKEREKQEFMEFIAAVGNTLYQLNPMILVHILNGLENRFAKSAAMQISKVAQQIEQQQSQISQAEQQQEMQIEQGRRAVDWAKLKKPNKSISVKFSPEDLQKMPAETQAMFDAANQ